MQCAARGDGSARMAINDVSWASGQQGPLSALGMAAEMLKPARLHRGRAAHRP